MNKRNLILEQLDNKIIKFKHLQEVIPPSSGWIHAIRLGINMSLRQLGEKMSITPQSVKEIEEREINGTVSLRVLKQVAFALKMDFVYGFVPHDQTLEQMIERRAHELAKQIVERASVQMELEDQKNADNRLAKAIKERTDELKRELPRYLWD
ncbi:MAG: mobile mystery protein A [Bacteroidales bacterium]